MIATLSYHRGVHILQSNCINCGNLFHYERRKIPKKFCSDSCKREYYSKREEITRNRELRWNEEAQEMIAKRSIEIPIISPIARKIKVWRMRRAAGF
ncbi:MAG TPA: hypothetical protein VFO37_05790 [Chitinophagaceae bacterium]|nr:hypothetical protein [Chitinophagaceae bacterium]